MRAARLLSPNLGSDEFNRFLVENAADAIVYVDVGGMVQFWNLAAQRIFGFSEEEALGKSLDIIIPDNLRQRHWSAFSETMRTGITRYGAGDVLAVPALRKDGTRVSIEFSILLLRNKEGQMLGAAAILRDVSKRFAELKSLRKEVAELRSQISGAI